MADHDSVTDSSTEENEVVATITSRLPLLKRMQDLSDFKIICEEWPVHKAVLVLHSPVLEQACAGDLKELNLSDFESRTVASLVHFLYNFEYATLDDGIESRDTGEHPGPLTFHVKMFLLGDHFDMDTLKSEAEKQLLDNLVHDMGMAGFDLARACAVAYGKRNVARRVCVPLVSYLVGHGQPFNGSHRYEELEEAMQLHPDLAIDLARATKMMLHAVEWHPDEHAPAYRCPKCGKDFSAFIFDNDLPYKCHHGCGAECIGGDWIEEHQQKFQEFTNRELGVEEVERGAWWRD